MPSIPSKNLKKNREEFKNGENFGTDKLKNNRKNGKKLRQNTVRIEKTFGEMIRKNKKWDKKLGQKLREK